MCSFEELNADEMEPEPATLAQLSLLKKLSRQTGMEIEINNLDKKSASNLISELTGKEQDFMVDK
jgi:hypothetical protein